MTPSPHHDDAAIEQWLCAHPINATDDLDTTVLQVFETLARVGRLTVLDYENGWRTAVLPNGRVILAVGAPATLLLLEAHHPSAIKLANVPAPANFVAVQAHPQDTTFLRGHNLLREALLRAVDSAGGLP